MGSSNCSLSQLEARLGSEAGTKLILNGPNTLSQWIMTSKKVQEYGLGQHNNALSGHHMAIVRAPNYPQTQQHQS